MSVDEVRLMIEVIYRESGKNTISVLNCLLENVGRNPAVTIDEFIVLVRKLPSLLYPVYDLIRSVRRRTLGEKRWIEIGKMRELPANNKFLFMNKMYGTNINVAKYNHLQQTKKSSNRLLNDSNSNMSVSASAASRIRSSFSFTGNSGSVSARDGSLGTGILNTRPNQTGGFEGNVPFHKRRSTVAVMDTSPSSSPIRLNNTMSSPYRASNSQSMYDMTPAPTPVYNSTYGNHNFNNTSNSNAIMSLNSNVSNKSNQSMNSFNHPASIPSLLSSKVQAAAAAGGNGNMSGSKRAQSMSAIHRVKYSDDTDGSSSHGGTARNSGAFSMLSSPKNNCDAIKIANEINLDRIKKANSQNLTCLLEANSTLHAYKRNSLNLTQMDTGRSDNSVTSGCSSGRKIITPRNSNFKDGFIVGRRYSITT